MRTGALDHLGWQLCSLGRVLCSACGERTRSAIAWNNTWWSMALGGCHGDRLALGAARCCYERTSGKHSTRRRARNPAGESKRAQQSAPTLDQRDNAIREAARRGHDEERRGRCNRPGDEIRLRPLDRKSGRKPRSRKVTRSVTMHTITLDISSANISRDLASMVIICRPAWCMLSLEGVYVHLRGLWRNPTSFAYSLTIAPGAQERPDGRVNL
jgi:hypothetical protein